MFFPRKCEFPINSRAPCCFGHGVRKSISSFVTDANLTRFVAIAFLLLDKMGANTFLCSLCGFTVSSFGLICFLGERNQRLTAKQSSQMRVDHERKPSVAGGQGSDPTPGYEYLLPWRIKSLQPR